MEAEPAEHRTSHMGLETESAPLALLGLRAAAGGILMGLANLVPGISGGTMLLAAGVYPAFVGAIADLSTLRIRLRPVLLVGVIAGAAALAILLLAGAMKALVVEQRWVMYSLFIGLTLGGVPLVWRLARPITPGVVAGAAVAFAGMLAMQLVRADAGSAASASWPLLLFSGLAGASAMILPGVSGGYLLLLLGQYEHILGAIDDLKRGLLGSGAGPDLALVLQALAVCVPVGIGVAGGVVGVSNLLRWLLDRFEKPTLGALLGLLFGAVVGLWPFQHPIPPQPGDLVRGAVVTEESLPSIRHEDWRVELFRPSPGQVGAAAALVAAGFAATLLIDRLGAARDGAAPREGRATGA
jgi:putative membrane protein